MISYNWYFLSLAEILDILCNTFIKKNVSMILYMTNNENYGSNTASSQYLMQLAGYLRIPVIAWNADSSGLMQVTNCHVCLFIPKNI